MSAADLVPVGHGLAGLSHDLRNVLAILGESFGLVGDLVGAAPPSERDDRLTRALDRIERQLDRAGDLATRLNRFAHTFDDPDAALPLSHVLEQAALLVDRRARDRSVALEFDLGEDPAGRLESAVDGRPAGSRLVLAADGARLVLTAAEDGFRAVIPLP